MLTPQLFRFFTTQTINKLNASKLVPNILINSNDVLKKEKDVKSETNNRNDRIPTVKANPQGWTRFSRRCGALAIKLGMMSWWDSWGQRHPVTVLHLADCVALQHHPLNKATIQEVGIGKKSPKKLRKHLLKYFLACNVAPRRRIIGFNVDKSAILPTGLPIRAAHFIAGQCVSVQAKSIGKGFQGAMKRWGFKGMPASHGCSLSHRAIGATGSREDPSGVMKGKKMAGRMGGKNATMQCLKVVKVDNAANCIFVRGSVPGPDNGIIRIWDSKDKVTIQRFLSIQAANVKGDNDIILPYPTIDSDAKLPREYVAPAVEMDPLSIKEE